MTTCVKRGSNLDNTGAMAMKLIENQNAADAWGPISKQKEQIILLGQKTNHSEVVRTGEG
jgi:hypothetical protein